MLDSEAPQGSFGLVMCSGYGPMFSNAVGPASAMGAMGMASMVSASPAQHLSDGGKSTKSQLDDVSSDDSATACPFSAVFLAGLAAITFLPILLGLVTRIRTWIISTIFAPEKPLLYALPPAHAPPIVA